MAVYKDKKRGTWYVSVYYTDWKGENARKVKRGFKTRKDAVAWENTFLNKNTGDLNMTFAEFYDIYKSDLEERLKENTCKIYRMHTPRSRNRRQHGGLRTKNKTICTPLGVRRQVRTEYLIHLNEVPKSTPYHLRNCFIEYNRMLVYARNLCHKICDMVRCKRLIFVRFANVFIEGDEKQI